MSSRNNWYELIDAGTVDSPALLLFPERVKANIDTAIKMVNDIDLLRPHVKTNKSPDAINLMIDAGINKFKCATIAEAEMMGECGAGDVLLAYQPMGPKLHRFIQLIKKYPSTQYSCLTDNLQAAMEQSAAFQANGLTVPVYVDLNIGMNRTGIVPGNDAVELYNFLSTAPGVMAAGLHAYDGHLRNPDIAIRKEECDKSYAEVEKLKEILERKGLNVPTIIAGGSPSFSIHANRKSCECSPGTFIYWDKNYLDTCSEQHFLPAVVLMTRVISCPSPNIVCTDLGHKSVAAENEISKRIFFLNANDLVLIGQSEEHLVLETTAGHSYKPGDILYGLPFHVCPTVALYERAYTVEKGRTIGEWMNKARDRKISI